MIKFDPRIYLARAFIMQLATTGENNQPWVCSVYFVADEELKLYWLSWPTRRHSVELETNPNAAVTMAVKTDQPIIGLGAEGSVDVVDDEKTVERVMKNYIEKYDNGKDFLNRFRRGENDHIMYRFTPSKYVLVDEVKYPGKGSIDIIV